MVTRFKHWFYLFFTLILDSLFGTVKLTKNADPDKCKYSGYNIGFDSCLEFSLLDGSMGKNAIIFGVDMSSYVHIDNKNKDILIIGKGATQGLDNTTLTGEEGYSINFSRLQRKFCLSLHYNGSNSFLLVNATKMYQFKAKNSQITPYPLFLGNISKDFTANNKKKKNIKWICLRIFFIIILLMLVILSISKIFKEKKNDIK